jgi:hypothetical protein
LAEGSKDKIFFIQAYYEDLEGRIAFLRELHERGHDNEALMLCCCYIEALGSQRCHNSERKAKNYCTILDEHSGNPIFGLVHPVQAKRVLGSMKLFQENFPAIEAALVGLPRELFEKKAIQELLAPMVNPKQAEWLADNMFKFTIAAISYDLVRSELVHDISASPVSFSETTYKGEPVPRLDFFFLHAGLQNICAEAKRQSIASNTWWREN